jgi:hypothetical protein
MKVKTIIAAHAVGLGLVAGLLGVASAKAQDNQTVTRLPACVNEDGSGGPMPCYWDAGDRGNRRGHDVLNVSSHVWYRLDGSRWTRHTAGPPRCASILTTASYEFPHQAYLAWRICRDNRAHGERWHYIGNYDRHSGVWAMPGWTTVYVKRGWFETS